MELTLIAVCRNEATTGHIEKFLNWNVPLFDHVLVYDDASDDGTVDLLKQAGINVIENQISMFRNELLIRERLLAEAKVRFPETAWFMILDLDEILTCNRTELTALITKAEYKKCFGISFKLVNLWKSEEYFRTDEYFNRVEKIHLWKNVSKMKFSGESGLHRELHPTSIKMIFSQDSIRILHLGFSTQEKIVRKFQMYKSLGQEGRSLWRLIDERFMETQALSSISSKLGHNLNAWVNQANLGQPSPTPVAHYLWEVRELEATKVDQKKKPFVTLVCLIYSGISWLEFAYGELLLLQKEFEDGEVEILFCANDASQEVLDFLRHNNIPHIEFNNPDSNEHYISRVYRAYNFATMKARSEFCLLVNSDMAYAPGFLTKMLMYRDRNSFVVAKLVESGTLKPGPLAIKKNYGKTLEKFRRRAFYKFALRIEQIGLAEGGLFMPLLVSRDAFLTLGGFPEGNLTPDSLPTYLTDGKFEVAVPGKPCVSGDAALFMKAEMHGVKHVTSLRSIAYHFQEGEKRHTNEKEDRKIRSGFAIANDSLTGINGERVLWDVLCEILERNNLHIHKWNTGKIVFPWMFLRRIARIDFRANTTPRVCLQNASYLPIIDPSARGIALLQDNLFDSRLVLLQKKVLHYAGTIITNSIPMVNLNAKNHFIWQPLPINDLFIGSAKTAERVPNKCLFVGAFNETKGWSEVREIIKNNPAISFELVSKYAHDSPGNLSDFPNNVKVHRRLSQEELLKLYDSASYFLLGSALETQCLAAIEAAARGVIVVMKKTGMLAESSYASEIGFFGNDLATVFTEALNSDEANLDPRKTILKMRLTNSVLEQEWEKILHYELQKSFYPLLDEYQTFRERVVRKLCAPRFVTERV